MSLFTHPELEPTDHEGQRLRVKYIDSLYDYFQHLSSTLPTRFVKDTAGYVYDQEHWAFRALFPLAAEKEGEPNEQVKSLYRKLSIRVHPDKCNQPWAAAAFCFVNDAYLRDDLPLLTRIWDHLVEHDTLSAFSFQSHPDLQSPPSLTKEEQIAVWRRQVWCQWYEELSPLVREVLVPVAVYEQRMKERLEKLETERKLLVAENEYLRRKCESLRINE